MTYDEEHAGIVHRLRSSGWDKIDAEQEADNLMAERTKRRSETNTSSLAA